MPKNTGHIIGEQRTNIEQTLLKICHLYSGQSQVTFEERLVLILLFMNEENRYRAYLIRLQREKAHFHWRVELHNAQTGERHCFATEQALLRYLEQSLTVKLADQENPIAPDSELK